MCIAGRHNDPANCNGDDDEDDDFPSIDELLAFSSKGISTIYQNSADPPQHLEGPALNTSGSRLDPNPRPDNGVGNSQGTRGIRPGPPSLHIKQPPNPYADRPVVLEDSESDTPEPAPQAAAVSVSVDAGADPASELSKGPWWDIEDECYVDDDLRPIPPLEQEGLASTPALAQPHFHHHPRGSSQDQVNRHSDGGMGGAPDEPAPHTLPQPLDENRGGSNENTTELGRDIQLAFGEQEKSSSATAPRSPRPHPPSAEPSHPPIDQEHNQGRTSYGRSEELGHGPPLRSQDGGEKAQEQQQRQEVAVELMREDDGEDPEEREEKRRHPDETKIGSDTHPKASDRNHNTGDEDNEDPRPTNRRRLPPTTTDNALTPPDEPAPVANDDHHPSRTSRSPSITVESALVAKYQE